MADQDDTVFGNYPVARWQVGTSAPVTFPVQQVTESGGNRLVMHERPYRDGAKLDDTGSKPRTFALTAIFNNSINEPGIDPSGPPLYPTLLRQLIRSFDLHETGTLTLPTVGNVRCRAQDYSRKEAPELSDTALLDLTFVQDNEDSLERTVLNPPGVVATIVRLAEQTQFTAQKDGIWSEDLGTLRERASEIESLMKAPGRAVGDVATVVRAHRRSLESLLNTAREESGVDGIFGEPRASRTERQLQEMLDREAQAEAERTASRPRTKAFVVDVEVTSIYEIAARLGQDATELMDLNAARIDDPFTLTRGEVIRVFETAA